MRRPLLLVVLAGLVLAACSGGDGDDEPAAVSTTTAAAAAPTTTTPESSASADPFAIPEVIDAAYVNRVLAELYRIDGDVVRDVLATGEMAPERLSQLRAIYNDPQFELELRGFSRLVAGRTDGFKAPPGDRKVTVTRLVRLDRECLVSEVLMDFSDVVLQPPAQEPAKVDFIALSPTQSDANGERRNPTPWSISDAETLPRGTVPDEPCG